MTETNASSLGPDKKGDATSTQPNAPIDDDAAAKTAAIKGVTPVEATAGTIAASGSRTTAASASGSEITTTSESERTAKPVTSPATGIPDLTESDEGRHAIEHAQMKAEADAKAEAKAKTVAKEKAEAKAEAQAEIKGVEKPEVELSPAELREYRIGRADGLVGVFVLTALLLGYGALCWWKSYSPLNPPQRFSVVFRDVASLNYQAPVFVDGVRVGSVDKIQIRGSENVLVGLKVNTQKIAIPVGSRFIILPNGVVGAKYIEIILPDNATAKNTLPLLTEKSVVQGDDPIRPEIVVNELVERLSTIDFSEIENKLSRNMDKLGNVADHVSTLSTKMEPVAAKAQIAVDNVSALSNDMRAPVQQMHQILDQKHPLMHMMFGRPGHIKEEKTVKDDKGNVVKQTTKVEKGKDQDSDDSDSSSDATKKKHHFWKL